MKKRQSTGLTDKHEEHWQTQERIAKQREQWFKTRKYGKLGAASPVRHIDPADYQPQPTNKKSK